MGRKPFPESNPTELSHAQRPAAQQPREEETQAAAQAGRAEAAVPLSRVIRAALVFALPIALVGCAGLPPSAPAPQLDTPGERAAAHAAKLVGTPYHYGGS